MCLLTKDYFVQNKWLALIGVVSGIAFSAMLLRWPLEPFAPVFGLYLLSFPYVVKTPTERLLRKTLIGLYLSFALVYGGKFLPPLAWLGFIGSSVLGAVVVCLRYNPPAVKLGTGTGSAGLLSSESVPNTEGQNADGI